jgi:hypothetical protein
VPRTPAGLALTLVVALATLAAGCGGGGSQTKHDGVEAFPDVLEIARSELEEDAVLHAVIVEENAISFIHVQFGRTTRITYNPEGTFTGSKRLSNPHSLRLTFPISEVDPNAPQRILAAVRENEGEDVKAFTATLAVATRGGLVWRVTATIGDSKHEYTASPDGTLMG